MTDCALHLGALSLAQQSSPASTVMPGLVPLRAAWMAGTSPAMTGWDPTWAVLQSSRSAPRALFVARALHPPPPSYPALYRASTPPCASAPRGWPGRARPWRAGTRH